MSVARFRNPPNPAPQAQPRGSPAIHRFPARKAFSRPTANPDWTFPRVAREGNPGITALLVPPPAGMHSAIQNRVASLILQYRSMLPDDRENFSPLFSNILTNFHAGWHRSW
jgi:hypothetical protein